MKPVPWSEIPGGQEQLEEQVDLIADEAEKLQARFQQALDILGEPGDLEWDPNRGFITMRGHTFKAQQLGSYDGETWLWSWANTHLNIPEELTSFARSLRDLAPQISQALAAPMLEDEDEVIPEQFAALAIANGFGEAFYFPNRAQIYLIVPGQIEPILANAPPPKKTRFATVFSHTRRSLADIVTHLRGDKNLAKLDLVQVDDDHATLTGTGYSIAITRKDKLRDVLAEVKTLSTSDQATARGAATAFVVEGTTDLQVYDETTYTAMMGGWAPADHFAGRHRIPWQALSVCERFNKLERVVVHDTLLGYFYPRS